MFTGLIEAVGTIATRTMDGDHGQLVVETTLANAMAVGDSIAVNGACLTVESHDDHRLTFHVLAQTFAHTNLAITPVGATVNLERALQLGDRLGGHLVSGHVDTTATVRNAEQVDDDYIVTIDLDAAFAPLVIDKGSIAVDGISLTVASLHETAFTVHIIPHTRTVTNLRDTRTGTIVNLEFDMMGKYILRQQQLRTWSPA